MVYSNLQIFTVELVGTFILVVFATGSIVYDAEVFDGKLGIPFAALAPFIALLIGVYSFGKISLAHFNPAVTLGYYITGLPKFKLYIILQPKLLALCWVLFLF